VETDGDSEQRGGGESRVRRENGEEAKWSEGGLLLPNAAQG
jgi:hypothetical protein